MKQACLAVLLAAVTLSELSAATATASSEHWEVKVRACTNQNFDCVHGCKEYVLNTSQCHVFEEAGAALAFRCSARKGLKYVIFAGPECETTYPAQLVRQTCGCSSEQNFLYHCGTTNAVAYDCTSCTNGTGHGCTEVQNATLGQCNTFTNPMESVALPSTYSMVPVMEYAQYPYTSCDAHNQTLMWSSQSDGECALGFGQTWFQITCEDNRSLAHFPSLPSSLIPHVLQSLKRARRKKFSKGGW